MNILGDKMAHGTSWSVESSPSINFNFPRRKVQAKMLFSSKCTELCWHKEICFQILKCASFQYCVTHGLIRAIIFIILFYKIKSFLVVQRVQARIKIYLLWGQMSLNSLEVRYSNELCIYKKVTLIFALWY